MEKQSKYLIILLVALVICIGVFWFQFNNDVATFIMINETEVAENELLNEYRSQTLEEGKHDVHIDGYYSDYGMKRNNHHQEWSLNILLRLQI